MRMRTVSILGAKKSGKSRLLESLLSESESRLYISVTKEIKYQDQNISFKICDTTTSASLTPFENPNDSNNLRGVQGTIVVFNLNDNKSFGFAKAFCEYNSENENLPLILVGTNADLPSAGMVDNQDALNLANQYNIGYFEFSGGEEISFAIPSPDKSEPTQSSWEDLLKKFEPVIRSARLKSSSDQPKTIEDHKNYLEKIIQKLNVETKNCQRLSNAEESSVLGFWSRPSNPTSELDKISKTLTEAKECGKTIFQFLEKKRDIYTIQSKEALEKLQKDYNGLIAIQSNLQKEFESYCRKLKRGGRLPEQYQEAVTQNETKICLEAISKGLKKIVDPVIPLNIRNSFKETLGGRYIATARKYSESKELKNLVKIYDDIIKLDDFWNHPVDKYISFLKNQDDPRGMVVKPFLVKLQNNLLSSVGENPELKKLISSIKLDEIKRQVGWEESSFLTHLEKLMDPQLFKKDIDSKVIKKLMEEMSVSLYELQTLHKELTLITSLSHHSDEAEAKEEMDKNIGLCLSWIQLLEPFAELKDGLPEKNDELIKVLNQTITSLKQKRIETQDYVRSSSLEFVWMNCAEKIKAWEAASSPEKHSSPSPRV